jgi:hypothetical protein
VKGKETLVLFCQKASGGKKKKKAGFFINNLELEKFSAFSSFPHLLHFCSKNSFCFCPKALPFLGSHSLL